MVNDKSWGFVGKVRQIGKWFLGDRHGQRQTPIHDLNNSAALYFQYSTLQSMTCLIGVANCCSGGRRPLELFQPSIEKFLLCELSWCVLKDRLFGRMKEIWHDTLSSQLLSFLWIHRDCKSTSCLQMVTFCLFLFSAFIFFVFCILHRCKSLWGAHSPDYCGASHTRLRQDLLLSSESLPIDKKTTVMSEL